MQISIIAVPYDSGQARRRMGRGPEAFLSGGLAARLEQRGHSVEVTVLDASGDFSAEPATSFDLNRGVASAVRAAVTRRAFPLVLSGNCISTVGALAGVGTSGLGLLWFDAHGDFNTPESTRTGFLDGMALSVACGGCWTAMAAAIPGFHPIAASRVVLAGGRDFDPGERERFEAAGGRVAAVSAIDDEGHAPQVDALRDRVSRVYVHLDLDVLDPAEGTANQFVVPNGLRRSQVGRMLERVRAGLAGLTLSAYDPDRDRDGRVLAAGIEFAAACVPVV